jgi:transposase
LASSPTLLKSSNGIQRQRPRINKRELKGQKRGILQLVRGGQMRFAGIDIASEKHVVAVVDADGGIVVKATTFAEDQTGYRALLELLGPPAECLVAMEATGHYWQNLFAVLAAAGFRLALINPLRTNRFAQEDLVRTKTDAIDALGIARFAQQKRPVETPLADAATQELKELVRLRERVLQDMGDATRRLHRSVDL